MTTSSCAGRVSVFLEGRKKSNGKDQAWRGEAKGCGTDEGVTDGVDEDDSSGGVRNGGAIREDGQKGKRQKSVPGGKGSGGRWLFVSHEPLDGGVMRRQGLSKAFGIDVSETEGKGASNSMTSQLRFVRFQFEPMVCRYVHESFFQGSIALIVRRFCTS